MIKQRRLTPMLLITPRITQPAQSLGLGTTMADGHKFSKVRHLSRSRDGHRLGQAMGYVGLGWVGSS